MCSELSVWGSIQQGPIGGDAQHSLNAEGTSELQDPELQRLGDAQCRPSDHCERWNSSHYIIAIRPVERACQWTSTRRRLAHCSPCPRLHPVTLQPLPSRLSSAHGRASQYFAIVYNVYISHLRLRFLMGARCQLDEVILTTSTSSPLFLASLAPEIIANFLHFCRIYW